MSTQFTTTGATTPATGGGSVSRAQRFTRRHPCPICGGGDDDPRGRGIRCYGFLSDDGRYAHCTNSDYAGALTPHPRTGAYTHLLGSEDDACRCGEPHGAAPLIRLDAPHAGHPTPAKITRAHLTEPPTAISPYRALESGAPLRKLRYGAGKGKRFVWQRPLVVDGIGDWVDCHGDRPLPDVYRAETLAASDPFAPLAITEGEKDAEQLARLGWPLVISPPDGVGSWREAYSPYAMGRQVVIFADQDENGKGQAHAEQVAASVTPYALTVRVVRVEDAHDVGDWIDAGGSLTDLLALAARTPQTQATSFTLQDECSVEGAEADAVAAWRERALTAEATLNELYHERAMENHYLAIPNEKMAAPVKVAAIALRRELRDGRHREQDAEGRPRIYRGAIAQRCGVKEAAAGAHLVKLATVGLFERTEKRSLDDTATYYAPSPLTDHPEALPTPERGNTWGGARVKRCGACGSARLETRITCRDCGAVYSVQDTNTAQEEQEEEDAGGEGDAPQTQATSFTLQDETDAWGGDAAGAWGRAWTQDTPPSATTVRDLASQGEQADRPICPEHGRGGAFFLTKAGPRCGVCDRVMWEGA